MLASSAASVGIYRSSWPSARAVTSKKWCATRISTALRLTKCQLTLRRNAAFGGALRCEVMDATLSGCAMASARVIIGQQLGATGGEVYACCTKASRAQVAFFDHLRMHHLLVYSTDEPRVAEQLSSSPAPCCRQERFLRSNGTIWPRADLDANSGPINERISTEHRSPVLARCW